jgi:hypothetical protein
LYANTQMDFVRKYANGRSVVVSYTKICNNNYTISCQCNYLAAFAAPDAHLPTAARSPLRASESETSSGIVKARPFQR